MSLFDSVKKAVSTREAAEHYGVRVGRNGMCRCPFHSDHDPSMKVDKRFHCFGCHADGDVVDFAARLFDLSPRNAALKIASDFGIAVVDEPEKSPKPKTPITVSDAERFHHQVSYCYHELAAYRNQLAIRLMLGLAAFITSIASSVLGISVSLFALLSVIEFFIGYWQNGIAFMVLAFLASPIGLPAIANLLLNLLDHLIGFFEGLVC